MTDQIHDNPHSRPVSKGTLRRLRRRVKLLGPDRNHYNFREMATPSGFKTWVKLNIRQLLAYYDTPYKRHKSEVTKTPGFTPAAAALLEV